MARLRAVALAWVVSLAVATPKETSASSAFTLYEMPTAEAGPCDLETGPDGALWLQEQLVNKLARIDPTTGAVTEYEIPWTLPELNVTIPNVAGRAVLACAVRAGADGHLYASNGLRNQLVKVDVYSKQIEVLTPPPLDPAGDLQPFNDMYTGPDGMFFTQTTGNVISYYEYATGAFKNYPVPTLAGGPLGLYYASDKKVYFCEFVGQKIGVLEPSTGDIIEYTVPLDLLGPAVIRVETQGAVWFTATVGNGVGSINMETGEFTAYPNDIPASLPSEDTLDLTGNVWYSTFNDNLLNRIDGSTGALTHIEMPGTIIPSPVSLPYFFSVAVHYGPGNAVWYTNELANQVGRYQL